MSEQFCTRVGNNIKKYRKEADLTLKQLGERVSLSEATIQKYENGNIKTIDTELLKKISDALGVEPNDLTEWGSKEEYRAYREAKDGEDEANIIKMYSQLTRKHKKAVRNLLKNLLECQ